LSISKLAAVGKKDAISKIQNYQEVLAQKVLDKRDFSQ
jgi:hypothetical protein